MDFDSVDFGERSNKKARKLIRRAKDILLGVVIGVVMVLILYFVLRESKSKNIDDVHVMAVDTTTNQVIETEVTIETISKKLEKIGELSTAQMTYTGIYSVEDGKIPFLTKKGYSMVYTAQVKAGIQDISQLEVEITDRSIVVTLPDIQIISVNVEPDSIGFYDEKFALFNSATKSDVVQGISIAEDRLKNETDLSDLIELSEIRAKLLIEALLTDIIGDRSLKVI